MHDYLTEPENRPLPDNLIHDLFKHLGTTSLYTDKPIDVEYLLEEYNKLEPGFAHKLSIVQFGEKFVGVDFDVDRACWYNTDNRYAFQDSYYDAAVDAVAVRLGYLIPYAQYMTEKFEEFKLANRIKK